MHKALLLILSLTYVKVSSQEIPQKFDLEKGKTQNIKTLGPSVLNRINSNADQNFHLPLDSMLLMDSTSRAEYNRMHKLFGSYEEFKLKFLALKIQEMPDLKLPNYNPATAYLHNNYCPTIGLGSPITFLYNKFSKHEKVMAKYRELLANKDVQKKINDKYNFKKVQQWTGLKDEKLTRFVIFCHFDDEYLARVSEYELIQTVFKKLDKFLAQEDTTNINKLIKPDTSKNEN